MNFDFIAEGLENFIAWGGVFADLLEGFGDLGAAAEGLDEAAEAGNEGNEGKDDVSFSSGLSSTDD